MSDDNGQDKKKSESVEKHLAEKRKSLDLHTRPMEVIDDLDWDVPDFDDGDEDLSPGPADEDLSPAATTKDTATTEDTDSKADTDSGDSKADKPEGKRDTGGTMMMSASAFKDAMDDESPGERDDEDDAAASATDDDEKPSEEQDGTESSAQEKAKEAASGTMMMSVDAAKQEYAQDAAESEDDIPEQGDEDEDEEAQATDGQAIDGQADVETAEVDTSEAAKSAGGTMLISGDDLNKKLDEEAERLKAEQDEKQADAAEETPYEQLAKEAEQRHEAQETSTQKNKSADDVAAGFEDQMPLQDSGSKEVGSWMEQSMLIGAVIILFIGIIWLLTIIF